VIVSDSQRQLDTLAEYGDASVRVLHRRGSLVGVPGRHGLSAWLYRRWGNRGNAIVTALGSFLAIAVSGTIAWVVSEPLVFPSLGATAFLAFETPLAEVASPRNTLLGHGTAIAAAAASLALFGLLDAPSAYVEGITAARVGAVALSVGLTGGILRLLRAAHPPAGATTIIVSSGLLAEPSQMLAVAIGVVLLTISCWLLNRAIGVPSPVWGAPA
jgi:CBS domain-containing membrane protein